MRDFRDLLVWRKAISLTQLTSHLTGRLPPSEHYRLRDQMRRAASSVGANIAEGHSRPHRREYRRFLGMAYASVKELHHHLLAARMLGLLVGPPARDAIARCEEVARMLAVLRRRLADAPAEP